MSDIPESPRSAVRSSWAERWRVWIAAGETTFIVGLWLAALGQGDMMFVALLIAAALIASIISIVSNTYFSPRQKIGIGIVVSVFLCGSGGVILYRHNEVVPEALLASQLTELKALDTFLISPRESIDAYNEEHLRRLFDFESMLSNNIWMWRRNILPTSVSSERSAVIDTYFDGSVVAIDPRYVAFTTASNGANIVNFIPGKLPYIRDSKQFMARRNELLSFSNSIQLPSNVRGLLKSLLKIVDDDHNLMTEVINDQYAQNANNLIGDQDGGSSYLGKTTNAYWARFRPLKPEADKIISSIRSYLNVGP
jgi:hypothetical protein